MNGSQTEDTQRRVPDIVFRDGQPAAVILDIDEYRDMLERLEDLEDLETLKQLREEPLGFQTLNEFLEEVLSQGSNRCLARSQRTKPAP